MELNKKLIQESFSALKPYASEVVDHFYSELFKKHPKAKDLFRHVDMKKQHLALVNGLAHIVEYLDEPDHLGDYLKKLGARSQNYGANPEHYHWIGDALLSTLSYYLEDNWNEELRANWTMVYKFGVEKMSEGQNQMHSLKDKAQIDPSLQEMVKGLAKELFKQALENEIQESLMQHARDKVREILKHSIELEVKALYDSISEDTKHAKDTVA